MDGLGKDSDTPGAGHDEFYELSDLEHRDLTSLNGKTAQGLSVDDDDELDEEEGQETTSVGNFISYFITGAGATFLILLALASLFGIAGGVGRLMGLQKPVFADDISAWTLCLAVGALLAYLAVLRVLLNVLFRVLGLVASWNWLHHAKELEPHLTALLFLSSCLAATLHFSDSPSLVKTLLSGVFMVACLAVKSHYMRSLAMSFNYENYRDRIELALDTDRILRLLWKARHTYKFRKRMVARNSSANFWRAGKGTDVSPKATMHHDDQVVQQSNTIGPFAKIAPLPRSAQSACSASNSSPVGTTHASPSMASPLHANSSGPAGAKHARSGSSSTEAEKKTNFFKFSHLAARTMGAVSSRSARDFRAENSRESRKQAAKLFKYMRPDDRAYLLPADLRCYVEDEGDLAFLLGLLKKNIKWQNAAPGSDEFVFGERALRKLIQSHLNELVAIFKSMQSIETALDKVDSIFSLVIVLVVSLCGAILFGNAAQLLVAMGTFLSGAAFIFSTAARNAFESLVFLLLVHPFDVGDRVFVGLGTQFMPTASSIPATMSGSDALDNLVVVEMHLLSTVFERWDGVRVYVPNYVLATKPVFNIRRSGPLVELQRIQISFSTPLAQINELRERLDTFVRADRTDFTDLSRVNFDAIESCNKIHLNIIAQYNGNWQDIDKQMAFRSRFIMFIKSQLEELQISYLPPVQRVALVDQRGKPLGHTIESLCN